MPDAAIPIFQTVNQQGEATLEVEAVIKALGLKLSEGKFGGNKPFNRVEWLEEITSTKREQVFGGETNTGHHRLELAAFDAFGPTLSIDGTNGVLQYANGNQLIDIFGEGGPTVAASKFLQLVSGFENWVCNFGTGFLTFPSSTFGSTTISHGLSVSPAAVFIEIFTPPVFGIDTQWQTPTNTSFQVFAQSPSVLNGTVSFSWLAIG